MTDTARRQSAEEVAIARAERQFLAEVTRHEMTVLHEDGLYRHVRFARPDTGIWSFDLATWPGHLALTGDIGALVMAREPDMLAFVRGPVNVGYWAEKVVAGKTRDDFAEEAFTEHVTQDLASLPEDVQRGWRDLTATELDDLEATVRRDLLDDMPLYLDDAHERLSNFEWVSRERGDVPRKDRPSYDFRHAWEWDLRGWSHRYLLDCHAIAYGVERYYREHVHD